MKKLFTILAVCLYLSSYTQTRDFSRLRDTTPLIDTCPDGTTWLNRIATSSCEVVAGCYTDEHKQEAYDFISDCMEGLEGMTSFSGLIDKVDTSPLKVGTVVLDDNGGMRNATFAEELLFLIQDYEKDCYNDSTYVEYWQHHSPPSTYDPSTGLSMTLAIYMSPTLVKEWQHRDPTWKGFSEWLENK